MIPTMTGLTYIVELTPEQANKLTHAITTKDLKPEEQKDKDFLDRVKTTNAPSYADFNDNSKRYKVFGIPSEVVQFPRLSREQQESNQSLLEIQMQLEDDFTMYQRRKSM